MSELSDPLLVARATEGDLAAFEVLVRRYQVRIFRLCLGMVGNHSDAEDAAQDVFFTAWRSIGRFRGDSQFSTWLYRVAVNRCLKHLGRRPPATHLIPERAGTLGNPEAELEADERLRATASALAELTVEQRTPLLLRDVEGLTYGEIAEVLGVTVTAVKSRLNRARVQMARTLDDQ